jgi:hypothetical protein
MHHSSGNAIGPSAVRHTHTPLIVSGFAVQDDPSAGVPVLPPDDEPSLLSPPDDEPSLVESSAIPVEPWTTPEPPSPVESSPVEPAG